VVTSTIEHQAVLAPCRYLRSLGHEVTFLSVDDQGRLDMGALAAAARGRGHEHDHGRHHEHDQDHEHDHGNAHDHGHGKVGLFTVMLANNETGVIQPVAGVVKEASAGGALVHTDAVQAAGKLPIDVAELGVSLLSLSSHKLHGPKGAGALYVRRGVDLAPLWHGGRQERGLRPGTENVAALVGFGQACELARTRLGVDAGRLGLLRARFESLLRARIPEARINGGGGSGAGTRGPGHPGDGRLPNTSSVSFAGLDGEAISINLDMLGVAVANGAACSAIDHAPSHVLVAMGQSEALARAAVRFSFGRDNTDADIDRIVELVAQVVTLLRGASA
jgi:cysteine desulfurase